MQGTIKLYRNQKGFGFIQGEDENEYYFHVSQIKSIGIPEQGTNVEFESNKSDKGLCATDIVLIKPKASAFIILGNERLKTSNIKDYGITYKSYYYQKIYKISYTFKPILKYFKSKEINYVDTGKWYEISEERYFKIITKERNFLHIVRASKGDCIGKNRDTQGQQCYIYAPYDGVFDLNNYCGLAEMEYNTSINDVKQETEDYLYITTEQGDSYKFFSQKVDFNIYDKLKEIDLELIKGTQ